MKTNDNAQVEGFPSTFVLQRVLLSGPHKNCRAAFTILVVQQNSAITYSIVTITFNLFMSSVSFFFPSFCSYLKSGRGNFPQVIGFANESFGVPSIVCKLPLFRLTLVMELLIYAK